MSLVHLSIHITVHVPISLVNMMCQQMSEGQSFHCDLKGQLWHNKFLSILPKWCLANLYFHIKTMQLEHKIVPIIVWCLCRDFRISLNILYKTVPMNVLWILCRDSLISLNILYKMVPMIVLWILCRDSLISLNILYKTVPMIVLWILCRDSLISLSTLVNSL